MREGAGKSPRPLGNLTLSPVQNYTKGSQSPELPAIGGVSHFTVWLGAVPSTPGPYWCLSPELGALGYSSVCHKVQVFEPAEILTSIMTNLVGGTVVLLGVRAHWHLA